MKSLSPMDKLHKLPDVEGCCRNQDREQMQCERQLTPARGMCGLAVWCGLVTWRGDPLLAMACTSISGRRGSPGKFCSARMAASIWARFRPGGAGGCTLTAGGGTDASGGFCTGDSL